MRKIRKEVELSIPLIMKMTGLSRNTIYIYLKSGELKSRALYDVCHFMYSWGFDQGKKYEGK